MYSLGLYYAWLNLCRNLAEFCSPISTATEGQTLSQKQRAEKLKTTIKNRKAGLMDILGMSDYGCLVSINLLGVLRNNEEQAGTELCQLIYLIISARFLCVGVGRQR